MDDKNVFAEVNAGKTRIASSIRKTAVNFLPYILLVLVVIVRVVLEIFHPSVVNPFTPIFFLDTALSLSLTMFCYVVFIPQGEKNERLNSPSYKPNCIRWGELSTKIRTGGLLEKFRIFCQEQVEVERMEIRAVLIGNHTTISFDEYIVKYSSLTNRELWKAYRKGEISFEGYLALKKCNGRIKVKPINSVLILSGVARANYNDAGRRDSTYLLRWFAKRPLLIMIFAIIAKAISGAFVGLNLSSIYGMILDTMSIIIASFVGYGAGEESIRDKDDKVKNRILFIESFLEKNNGGGSAESRNICIHTKEDSQ